MIELKNIASLQFFKSVEDACDHILRHYLNEAENWLDLVRYHRGNPDCDVRSVKVKGKWNQPALQKAYEGYAFATEKEMIGVVSSPLAEDLYFTFSDTRKNGLVFEVLVTLNGVLVFERKGMIRSSFRVSYPKNWTQENHKIRYARFLKALDYIRHKTTPSILGKIIPGVAKPPSWEVDETSRLLQICNVPICYSDLGWIRIAIK